MITNLSLIKSLFCTARTIFDCFSCILLQLAHSIYIGTVRHKLLFSFGTFKIDSSLASLARNYRNVASSSLSRLVVDSRIFRLFIKGKFDAYAP